MGQSLAPLLVGEPVSLTRPVLAEGRLKKALIFPDGYKVIVDDRNGTQELYNLGPDPGELEDLSANPDAEMAARVVTLRAFFEAHRFPRPGYKPPFRK